MMRTPLYTIELRGDSRARGVQHGPQLREPIQQALDFYRGFFKTHLKIDAAEMRRRARGFIDPTARTSALLMSEYEGIAEGAGQTLEDIFALSARYEITFEHLKLGECSNVFVGPQRSRNGHPLLGMNWEWRPEVMAFRAVITARCDDQPDHVVVTECGQPGKYGLNANGIAAIETGLGCSQTTTARGENLFAVVIRHILAQPDLASARRVVNDHPPQATISFFVADAGGHGANLEATPSGVVERDLRPDEIYWHTNHCRLVDEPCSFEDSFVRADRWVGLTRDVKTVDAETVGKWLADRADGPNAICKLPPPELSQAATCLQTLTSIVLDPTERAIWVSDGPSSENEYARYDLESSE